MKKIKAFACVTEGKIDEIWAFPPDNKPGGCNMLIFLSEAEAKRRAKFDSSVVVPVIVSYFPPRASRAK